MDMDCLNENVPNMVVFVTINSKEITINAGVSVWSELSEVVQTTVISGIPVHVVANKINHAGLGII